MKTMIALIASAGLLGLSASPALASTQADEKPLADILMADDAGFDTNSADFDILRAAVVAVLDAKPESKVNVLTDGSVALTAFIPTDAAFQGLAENLGGVPHYTEKEALNKLTSTFDIDTIEQVLLYHVIPGTTVSAAGASVLGGKTLETAQGGEITVDVRKNHCTGKVRRITLRDGASAFRDARVILKATDINKGNKQIAHAIDWVLLPKNV